MKKQNQNSVVVFRCECDGGETEWFDTEFNLDAKESFVIDADALKNGYVFHRYKIETRGTHNPCWTYVYGKIEDEANFKKQLFKKVVEAEVRLAESTDGGCYKVIVETCVLEYTSKWVMQPVRTTGTDSLSFEVVYDADADGGSESVVMEDNKYTLDEMLSKLDEVIKH